MDYNKIGNFIMSERKAKRMTQAKLAEKLFVSEKTISKWEKGNGIPDTNLLPRLCEIFDVSINEILNGERIANENYKSKAEEGLLALQKQKMESDKLLLKIEIVLGWSSVLVLFFGLFVAIYLMHNFDFVVLPILIFAFGFVVFVVGILFCLLIEQKAGYYICENCKQKHVPTYKQTLFSMHLNRTRYMRCPHCKKMSWNKKILK